MLGGFHTLPARGCMRKGELALISWLLSGLQCCCRCCFSQRGSKPLLVVCAGYGGGAVRPSWSVWMLPLLLSLLRSLLLVLARQGRPAACGHVPAAVLPVVLLLLAVPPGMAAVDADSRLMSSSKSLSAKGQASKLSTAAPAPALLSCTPARAAVLVLAELVLLRLGLRYCAAPLVLLSLSVLLPLLVLLVRSRAAAGR